MLHTKSSQCQDRTARLTTTTRPKTTNNTSMAARVTKPYERVTPKRQEPQAASTTRLQHRSEKKQVAQRGPCKLPTHRTDWRRKKNVPAWMSSSDNDSECEEDNDKARPHRAFSNEEADALFKAAEPFKEDMRTEFLMIKQPDLRIARQKACVIAMTDAVNHVNLEQGHSQRHRWDVWVMLANLVESTKEKARARVLWFRKQKRLQDRLAMLNQWAEFFGESDDEGESGSTDCSYGGSSTSSSRHVSNKRPHVTSDSYTDADTDEDDIQVAHAAGKGHMPVNKSPTSQTAPSPDQQPVMQTTDDDQNIRLPASVRKKVGHSKVYVDHTGKIDVDQHSLQNVREHDLQTTGQSKRPQGGPVRSISSPGKRWPQLHETQDQAVQHELVQQGVRSRKFSVKQMLDLAQFQSEQTTSSVLESGDDESLWVHDTMASTSNNLEDTCPKQNKVTETERMIAEMQVTISGMQNEMVKMNERTKTELNKLPQVISEVKAAERELCNAKLELAGARAALQLVLTDIEDAKQALKAVVDEVVSVKDALVGAAAQMQEGCKQLQEVATLVKTNHEATLDAVNSLGEQDGSSGKNSREWNNDNAIQLRLRKRSWEL